MPLYRRSLRRIAWTILAVWLYALGAGVANACLLSTPSDSRHASFSEANPGTPVAHTHQQEPTDPSTTGCLKFCDESATLAIPKLDQPIGDGGAGMVGVLNRAQPPAVTSATAVRLPVLTHRPAHLALPIAARPHRLTL